jgi:hypothetical protein
VAATIKRKQKATQKDFVYEVRKPPQIIQEVIGEVSDKIKTKHGYAKDPKKYSAVQKLKNLKGEYIAF